MWRAIIKPSFGVHGNRLNRLSNRFNDCAHFILIWIIDDQGDRWVRSKVPPIIQQPEPQDEPASAAAKLPGDFAPKLVQLTEDVLFADVWEREELSKRDRSLITVAALVALNRPDQLRFHLGRAVENGVRAEELIEAITHLAFYSGWPNAMTAMTIAKELFAKAG